MEVLCLMGQSEATRLSDWIIPAVVDSSGNPNCAALAASTTAHAADLTTLPVPPGFYDTGIASVRTNPLGHYINFQAQGTDVFVIFGPSFASVTGSNAPLDTTTNTVSGSTGAITMAKKVCLIIPQNQTLPVLLPAGATAGVAWGTSSPWRFVGYVTANGTSGTLRVWQSSP